MAVKQTHHHHQNRKGQRRPARRGRPGGPAGGAMSLAVIGAGHVGLVSGACFAAMGHRVIMVDNDRKKLAKLRQGLAWFYEPGLEALLRQGVREKRLSFTPSIASAVKQAEVIFICVGTPPRPNGDADLTAVEHVAREIAEAMPGYRLIVEKSTVPVQTGQWVGRTLQHCVRRGVPFDVASNPEFLREGSAIYDTMHPDRIVLGVESERAKDLLLALYQPLNARAIVTDVKSAEIIKHASNSFLAMKISFMNAVAELCDLVGADVMKVADGMGHDTRIQRPFLNAGVGYGGFCFPKDLEAFIRIAEKLGYDFRILKAVTQINADQPRRFVGKIAGSLWNLPGKTIAVLGLAFKPNTDDMRFAPSLEVIRLLQQEGAKVRAYDPKAMAEARPMVPGVTLCRSAYEALRGADCLALVTEWQEFAALDFVRVKKLMRQPVVVDGRNLFDPDRLRRLGFRYAGMGRGGQD